MEANNGTTASNAIADLCGNPSIAEEVSKKLKSSKMRDYIEYIYAVAHNVAQKVREGKEVDVLDVLTRIEFFAKEANETPMRNCDVGTAEEQAKRLNEWCSGRHCVNCQFKGGWPDECKLQWAQMPYKEGGAR